MSAGNVPLVINDKGKYKSGFTQQRKETDATRDGRRTDVGARHRGWELERVGEREKEGESRARRRVYQSVSSDTMCFPMLFVLIS